MSAWRGQGAIATTRVLALRAGSPRHYGARRSMRSIDLDGPIGGYNRQAAWITGWLAAARLTPNRS